ncbi:hypothetical protein [Streptomyces sp. KR80]|uniref:hypothetical protein n=1 Tax=Streptomyces sp. KR80 TaxID=3457426 RepID=UPI003FD30D2A
MAMIRGTGQKGCVRMEFGVSTSVTDDGITPTALGPAREERGSDSLFVAQHSHETLRSLDQPAEVASASR